MASLGRNKETKYGDYFSRNVKDVKKWYYNDLKQIVEDNMFEIHELSKSTDLVDLTKDSKSKLVEDLRKLDGRLALGTWSNNYTNLGGLACTKDVLKNYNHKFKTVLGSIIYFKLVKDITFDTINELRFWIEK